MPELQELIKLVAPLGAGGILAVVVFWFYHREFVKKVNNANQDRQTLIEVVARNAATNERVAQAIDGLSDTMERSEQARQRQLEILLQTVAGRRHVRGEGDK